MYKIPDTVKKYGDVEFGKRCIVGEYCVIGYPYVECEKSFESKGARTSIGDRCVIGSHVVIYGGAQIGDETRVDDFCRIGEHVSIGKKCHQISFALPSTGLRRFVLHVSQGVHSLCYLQGSTCKLLHMQGIEFSLLSSDSQISLDV